MPKRSSGIPDRWDKYTACGKQIEDSPFIAFKAPLTPNLFPTKYGEGVKTTFNSKWTPRILIDSVPQLVLVIDLTNTNRYYDPSSLKLRKKHARIKAPNEQNPLNDTKCDNNCDINIESHESEVATQDTLLLNSSSTSISSPLSREIQYIKIYTQGHAIPSSKIVKTFFDAVEKSQHKQKGGLIGVHCTHGVNRTGYLICRYLIERLQWSPEKAIEGFKKYRGHPIERTNYLDDLRRCTWIDNTEEKLLHAPTDAQNSQDKCESGPAAQNDTHRRQKIATTQGVANLSHGTENSHIDSDSGSDGLSEREKTCITDNLLASNFDIGEDSLS